MNVIINSYNCYIINSIVIIVTILIVIMVVNLLLPTPGDAVITINNYESLLTILASDDPHGVFEFTTNSSNVITNEGSTLNLM